MALGSDLQLAHKHALVLGASRGIGRAIAIGLANAGAKVHVLARNGEELNQLLRSLTPSSQGQALVCDVSDRESLQRKLRDLSATTGPVHILVNNTGGPPGGLIAEATESQFLEAFANHLLVNLATTKVLLEGMKAAAYGRIINIISTSVKVPIPGLGVSNTIRGAVASWAKTLANEVAPWGITVNNILPGATATQRLDEIITTRSLKLGLPEDAIRKEMLAEIPAGRFAQPEDIAHLAVFLASQHASYITGTSIPVDGGRTKSL